MDQGIHILGAGIAGLVAANLLADAGARVHVYERRRAVGSYHGRRTVAMLRRHSSSEKDVLGEMRELGIPHQLDHQVSREIRISRSYQVALRDRTTLFSVIRGDADDSLDSFLLGRALSRGVAVSFGVTTPPARVDIIATGAPEPNIWGYGQTLRVRSPDPDTVYTIYDGHCVPGGYFCVMPSAQGDATFLAVTFDQHAGTTELPRLYAHVLSHHPVIRELARGAEVVSQARGGGFYAQDPYALCMNGRALRVGEAAGFLGAARGFGIRYAMITGALAARALISGRSFRELAKEYLGDEFQAHLVRRRQLASLTDDGYDQMVKAAGGEPISSVAG